MFKIKKLNENAKVPTRYLNAAGYDLYAAEDCYIEPGQKQLVKLGFAMQLPSSHFARIVGRSGISLKTALNVIEGTVDPDYRGEVSVIMHNTKQQRNHHVRGYATIDNAFVSDNDKTYLAGTYKIRKGDKISQMIIAPLSANVFSDCVEVDELDDSERGSGGFGSSGV